jgi:peptidoglycan hydrolase-like protein with peptidoglycan-binding domain
MKQHFPRFLLLALLLVCGAAAFAQSEPAATQEPAPLLITRKEVAAVQAELQRRGYYRNTPHGILDGETRGAILLYQKESKLEETGRIDRLLLKSLDLKYPATGKEVESARKKGLLPRLGYGAKDTVTGARDTTVNAGKSVKRGAENAVDKTKDKTVELAQDAGDATVKGAKKAGNKTVDTTTRAGRRVSEVVVGRSDAELQRDIREVLDAREETARVRSEVKDGDVKLFPNAGVDVSDAVSGIRKISGVRSVVVVAK